MVGSKPGRCHGSMGLIVTAGAIRRSGSPWPGRRRIPVPGRGCRAGCPAAGFIFTELLTGRPGRIWVTLSTAGQRVENEDYDPDNPFSEPVTWPESTRYDVFEPDGTYLGVVAPPDEFSGGPDPVFEGDHVWAVTRDELGVERVVRFRIEVGGG